MFFYNNMDSAPKNFSLLTLVRKIKMKCMCSYFAQAVKAIPSQCP